MNKEEKGKHHIILVVTQKCKPIKNLDYYMCHNQCVLSGRYLYNLTNYIPSIDT